MALRSKLACCALAVACCLPPTAAQAAPSTFGTIFGNALLCIDQVERAYFHEYLSASFGPAYKREGGADWFRVDARLWGVEVTEAIVSDDSSDLVFVGAVLEATPEELDVAIASAAGVRHIAVDQSAFPVRQARPGSKIVYFNTKSKIYCARYKPLPPE